MEIPAIISETYKFYEEITFEARSVSFSSLICCLRHEKKYIPVFIESNLCSKNRFVRFIPIIDDKIYLSPHNMNDGEYTINASSVLVVSNFKTHLYNTKLKI